MDGRFNTHPFVSGQEEPGTTTENGPGTTVFGGKTTAISSPKRRRAVQKRVLSVPIGEVDGSKVKGEAAPPSDSWAWRKYGQKPIKGSPYPRGYYRCSSWKGCPARKQVERSRTNPTMLVITYACDHNHPLLTSKNTSTNAAAATSTSSPDSNLRSEEPAVFSGPTAIETDDRYADLETNHTLLLPDDFSWFSNVESSPTKDTLLESPVCAGTDDDVPSELFPMREEDESLFADLGELPECSVVFRCGGLREAPLCGSTG